MTTPSARSHLIWDILVFFQEHLELGHADPEVTVCKVVGDVPAQGAKLAPLNDDAMEEAEGEQEVFELCDLREAANSSQG